MYSPNEKNQWGLSYIFIDFANENYSTLERFIRPVTFLSSRDSPKLKDTTVKLQRLLISIIEDQKIKASTDMQYFINAFDEHIEYKVTDGKLTKAKKREIFPENVNVLKLIDKPVWLRMLSYSLISFLTKSNQNTRKLKRCTFCHDFFIANDVRKQRCKSDDCRKAYEREKKRKQRQEDPVRYL